MVVRRSARRSRTVSARWDGDRVLLLAPAGFSTAQSQDYVGRLMPRLLASRGQQAHEDRRSDAWLRERAQEVAARYLDSRVRPTEIRWVTNQNTRWGSTTPATGHVRLSHRLQGTPDYVVDAVIHHELCHLLEASHSPRFRRLEALFPHTEKAWAYLEGMVFGAAQARGEQRSGRS